MLSVRYGVFHPQLEDAFIARLQELIAAYPAEPLAVVAPSRRLADRLQRLVSVERRLNLLNVHFHTFYSLALKVVEESGLPDKILLRDPVFHDRVVDSLLDRRRELGLVFGGSARPKALAGALRASMRDLIDAGISEQAADLIADHFGDELISEPAERERLAALLSLTRAYELRLNEIGVMPLSGLTRLATERAENSSILKGFREILYYGFYDLTGLQLDFFEAVVSRYPATLFFPYRRGHPAFRFADDFYEQKLARYDVQPCTRPERHCLALGNAHERLFVPTAPFAADSAVRLSLMNASGARDEIWAVAKEISRLTLEEGVAYEEIGVIARSLEPYRADIIAVFESEAIPYDLEADEPLLRHPLAKAASNLLSVGQHDFPAGTIDDILASPYFSLSGWTSALVRRARALIVRLGIDAGWLQWRGKLEEGVPERLHNEEATAAALWKLLMHWEQALNDKQLLTWRERARCARSLLTTHFALPATASSREQAVWVEVLDAVDRLAAFDLLGDTVNARDFSEALESQLRRKALPLASGCRGVRVCSAMDARGDAFGTVFLIGLKEGLFPRQVREDPLLRDSTRAALRHPAGYWIARKASGYEEERLLFYLACTAATQRLYAVYPRSDESGKAEVPSPYLRELCRATQIVLGDPAVDRRVPRQPAERLRWCAPTLLRPREVSLRAALENRSSALYLRKVDRDPSLLEDASQRLSILNSSGSAGSIDGIIGDAPDLVRNIKKRGLSPSALDSFARCPFQFFAHYGLDFKNDEDAVEKGDFSRKKQGEIYHAVLERFYRGLSPTFWDNPTASADEALAAAVESVFHEHNWRALGLYPLLWHATKELMIKQLKVFVAGDLTRIRADQLRPALFEAQFQYAAPGAMPRQFEGLTLQGKIDRVDVDRAKGGYRVIDYKTKISAQFSSPQKLAHAIASGDANQLPIYIEAAMHLLACNGDLQLAEAGLYDIEEAHALLYPGFSWAGDRNTFLQSLTLKLEKIAQGRFSIKPSDGDRGYCAYCRFDILCRKAHTQSRQRSQEDAS